MFRRATRNKLKRSELLEVLSERESLLLILVWVAGDIFRCGRCETDLLGVKCCLPKNQRPFPLAGEKISPGVKFIAPTAEK